MGFWGFAPFQNDYALDEYGGYNTPEHLKGLIWQGIRRGVDASVDVHEIMGMILRTFKVYDGICSEEVEKEIVRAVATKKFTEDTRKAMSGETPMMIMSCATINFEERKKMLTYAANKMMGIIERNNENKDITKEEISRLFEEDKTSNNIFNEDKIWIQDVSNDEENLEYQKIYNLARKIINNNFEDITHPMTLLPEHVAWLVKMEKQEDKNRFIKHIKEEYPVGITEVALESGHTLRFDNNTKRILRDFRLLYGTTSTEIGLKVIGAKDWFPIHYPNGFYWYTGRLVSIDTKQPLEYEDGEQKIFKIEDVKAVKLHVPVYKTKIEYETAMSKKQKENQVKQHKGLVVRCTNKSYKGTKIYAYELMDQLGNKMWVDPNQLKDAIRNEKVTCTNMKLTSDNRLITIND